MFSKSFFYPGIIILTIVLAKSCRSIRMDALNENNAIYQSEECLLIFFSMRAEDTKSAHLSSKYGTYSTDDPNFKRPTPIGFLHFPCIVGIAYFDQVLPLQNLLIWCKRKQIFLLDSFKNGSLPLPMKQLEGRVDRRHHPLLVLRTSADNEHVEQVVICNGAKIKKTINHYLSGQWVIKRNLNSMIIERVCNNGNHMLFGRKLKASAFSVSPYMFFDTNNTEVTGLSIELTKIVAEKYQFTVDFIPATQAIGFDLLTVEVLGTFGEVLYGRVDFAVQYTYHPYNEDNDFMYHALYANNSILVDSCYPHFRMEHVIVTNNPGKVEPMYNFSSVFDAATWILSIFSFVCVTIVYTSICKITRGEHWLDTMWVPYGIWFQEFHEFRPRVVIQPLYGRFDYFKIESVVKLLWTLTTFLLMSSFLGALKSHLIIQKYEDTLDTLEELLNDGRPVFISDEYHIVASSLNAGGEIGQKILQNSMTSRSLVESSVNVNDIILQRAHEEGGAALNVREHILYQRGRALKQGKDYPMYIIPQRFNINYEGFIVQRYSPLAEPFDEVIMHILDSGIIDHLFETTNPFRSVEFQRPKFSSNDKIVVAHIMIPLAFYIIGIILAVIFYIQEDIDDIATELGFSTSISSTYGGCCKFKIRETKIIVV